jgi:hypothetical protein
MSFSFLLSSSSVQVKLVFYIKSGLKISFSLASSIFMRNIVVKNKKRTSLGQVIFNIEYSLERDSTMKINFYSSKQFSQIQSWFEFVVVGVSKKKDAKWRKWKWEFSLESVEIVEMRKKYHHHIENLKRNLSGRKLKFNQ